jgi:hypothetical protein
MGKKQKHAPYEHTKRGDGIDKWTVASTTSARRKEIAYETTKFIATIVAESQARIKQLDRQIRKHKS